MNNKCFRICLLLAVCLLHPSFLLAQVTPTVPNNDSRRQPTNDARVEADLQNRMTAMRGLEKKMITLSERDTRELIVTPQLDRKARERVFSMRRIESADVERYLPFVSGARSGIFKIFPDYDCVSKNVIRIDGPCANFVPESSSFSFRVENYTDSFYHDIGYKNDEIYSDAFFSQGIFVPLGDVPFESIDSTNSAVKALDTVKVAGDPNEAKELALRFKSGVEIGGLTYSQHLQPLENTTYAMRMIAYRIQNSLPPATKDSSLTEMRFLSLAFDRRIDQIVVFRVIRKSEAGALTIVWKELSHRDAPKIKFSKQAPLVDFKP